MVRVGILLSTRRVTCRLGRGSVTASLPPPSTCAFPQPCPRAARSAARETTDNTSRPPPPAVAPLLNVHTLHHCCHHRRVLSPSTSTSSNRPPHWQCRHRRPSIPVQLIVPSSGRTTSGSPLSSIAPLPTYPAYMHTTASSPTPLYEPTKLLRSS